MSGRCLRAAIWGECVRQHPQPSSHLRVTISLVVSVPTLTVTQDGFPMTSTEPAEPTESSEDPREAALRDLFPEAFSDGILDPTVIGEIIGVSDRGSDERYALGWRGKSAAQMAIRSQSKGTLHPDHSESVEFDRGTNLFVEGDNLEILRLLQRSYNDQVKLIYIDPPYNINGDFVYNDDFTDPLDAYLRFTGQRDSEGRMVSATVESGGRVHSGWLTMMYPRLQLARNLLRYDGAIFVSIDDAEVNNLRHLMNLVFGQENFIAQFVWAAGRKNDAKLVSTSHEYILCYARELSVLKREVGEWRTRKDGLEAIYKKYRQLKRKHRTDFDAMTADLQQWYRDLPDSDPAKRHKHYRVIDKRGIYFPDNISWPGGGGPRYDVLHPTTKKPCKVPSGGWRFTPEAMETQLTEDRVHFGPDHSTVPCRKSYLVDHESEVPYSVFYQDGRAATKRLRALMGGDVFENPKDETVLQRIIEFATEKDDLVLDFFAGSGSSAHAVMLQNKADGGNRRFISVNLPEPTPDDSTARNLGYETVSSITRERIRRAAAAVEADDFSLRCLTLGESNFKVWDPEKVENSTDGVAQAVEMFAESRASHATDDGTVMEILLREGVRIDAPWNREHIAGADLVRVEGVAVCLATVSTDELVKELSSLDGVSKIVVLDAAFEGRDAHKTNLALELDRKGIVLRAV